MQIIKKKFCLQSGTQMQIMKKVRPQSGTQLKSMIPFTLCTAHHRTNYETRNFDLFNFISFLVVNRLKAAAS